MIIILVPVVYAHMQGQTPCWILHLSPLATGVLVGGGAEGGGEAEEEEGAEAAPL